MEPSASPLLWPRAIFHSPFSIFQPCTISEGPETPQKGLKGHSHLHHWQLGGGKSGFCHFSIPDFITKKASHPHGHCLLWVTHPCTKIRSCLKPTEEDF